MNCSGLTNLFAMCDIRYSMIFSYIMSIDGDIIVRCVRNFIEMIIFISEAYSAYRF